MFSVWRYYRHPGALNGRMIVENDCLILHIFPMSVGVPPMRDMQRLREEVLALPSR